MKALLLHHQVADDNGAVEGPEATARNGRPPGLGGGFVRGIQGKVVAGVWVGARPWSLWRRGRGQGVNPCHQAGPPSQGHKDQVPGGDLPLLPEITDSFLGAPLQEEVLKNTPVLKQTRTGQRTRSRRLYDPGVSHP